MVLLQYIEDIYKVRIFELILFTSPCNVVTLHSMQKIIQTVIGVLGNLWKHLETFGN